jgi:hypothetical protein
MTRVEIAAQPRVTPSGLAPVGWTFRMSRAEPEENVYDDSASETLIHP